jgi:hypothetical protein
MKNERKYSQSYGFSEESVYYGKKDAKMIGFSSAARAVGNAVEV